MTDAPLLLSLPEEALDCVLSFSFPEKDCQIWEWIGLISKTCKALRPIAQSRTPSRLMLAEFKEYKGIGAVQGSIDARLGILKSLRDFSWKRQNLEELHVNRPSVLTQGQASDVICDGVVTTLRTLLTLPASFPKLEWLDLNIQYECDIIDAESLSLMPSALPSLKRLCLCDCFKLGNREISPDMLEQFFMSLQTPLASLSFSDPDWMTHAHVEAIMPIIGNGLDCLEMIDCVAFDNRNYATDYLADKSLFSVAEHCTNLKSFAIAGSLITSQGLERVFSTNPNIVTLNLSNNRRLNTSVVRIINRHLPRLKEIRIYWNNFKNWLTDDGLIALIDAQEEASNGSGIFLKLIGLKNYSSLTIRGLCYAIEKGVNEIEVDSGKLCNLILALECNVAVYQPKCRQYIDGSHNEH